MDWRAKTTLMHAGKGGKQCSNACISCVPTCSCCFVSFWCFLGYETCPFGFEKWAVGWSAVLDRLAGGSQPSAEGGRRHALMVPLAPTQKAAPPPQLSLPLAEGAWRPGGGGRSRWMGKGQRHSNHSPTHRTINNRQRVKSLLHPTPHPPHPRTHRQVHTVHPKTASSF